MKIIKKMLVITFTLGMLAGVLSACSDSYLEMLDYDGSDAIIEAINDGDGLEGKYVLVKVLEIEPNSAFGYNLQAYGNLNFVSAENPNAEVGDLVVFKIEKMANMFGSYIITYEDHKIIDQ